MGEMKHTPGPWAHYHGPRDTMVSINTLDGKEIGGVWCETWSTKERGINENVISNARLIAAAPDLLDAARLALNYIENTESEFGITLASGDALRAALSKAEGRSLSSASGQEGGE